MALCMLRGPSFDLSFMAHIRGSNGHGSGSTGAGIPKSPRPSHNDGKLLAPSPNVEGMTRSLVVFLRVFQMFDSWRRK